MERLALLFITFFKIGALTFGGGYAMLPMIKDEVLKNGWFTLEELINFIAVSESTPGSFAVNISTYAGMMTGGILGGIAATLGVVLPSFFVIIIIAKFSDGFSKSKIYQNIMQALKPAIVGLVFSAAIFVFENVYADGISIGVIIIFFGAILLLKIKAHPIIIIILSALLGIIFF